MTDTLQISKFLHGATIIPNNGLIIQKSLIAILHCLSNPKSIRSQ